VDEYTEKYTFHNKSLLQAGRMLLCFGYDMIMTEYMHM